MIGALVAALVCGEDVVIEEVSSVAERVDGEGRVTLVQGFGDRYESVGRLAVGVAWEPSGTFELRVGARVVGALLTDETVAYEAFAEPRVSLRWRGDAGEVAIGFADEARWSPLIDPLPADLRLGPLPATGEPEDRRRAIPFVSLRRAFGSVMSEVLWQPWYRQAGAGVEVDGRGLEDGAVGARVGVRLGTAGVNASWLWRRETVAPFVRQHSLGVDGEFTTSVVHWRAAAAWHSGRAEWLVDDRAHDGGALEGLLSVSAAPTIFLDGELGLRAASSPSAVEVWARLTLLMAFDGLVRLDGELHVGLDRDDQQAVVALVWRAAAAAEVAIGACLYSGVDGTLGALYDARDQVWARLSLDL